MLVKYFSLALCLLLVKKLNLYKYLVIERWSEHINSKQLQDHIKCVASITTSLQWINVQATLLDICIAFHPLDLPSYVILEIVDRFPLWLTHINRKKKIDYIIQIKRFCDNLKNDRQS
jgi:hypothetical protein